jgi:hypothetical protein
MLVFNGGDDGGPGGNTHAVLAFVTSGHIAFLDAQTREPVDCIDVGTQAHAAWPTPDQRHLIVANQNGKKLQRIRTEYRNETFVLEDAATIDLAACTTPSGAACQDPNLRPDNGSDLPAHDERRALQLRHPEGWSTPMPLLSRSTDATSGGATGARTTSSWSTHAATGRSTAWSLPVR